MANLIELTTLFDENREIFNKTLEEKKFDMQDEEVQHLSRKLDKIHIRILELKYSEFISL